MRAVSFETKATGLSRRSAPAFVMRGPVRIALHIAISNSSDHWSRGKVVLHMDDAKVRRAIIDAVIDTIEAWCLRPAQNVGLLALGGEFGAANRTALPLPFPHCAQLC